jgi:hypothetical protein
MRHDGDNTLKYQEDPEGIRTLPRNPMECEIISHGVWLYYRFTLSYRDVQELLFERGVIVSHEAIRKWCRKFGQDYANRLRRRRPQPGDKWHLDEVFLTINWLRVFRNPGASRTGHRRRQQQHTRVVWPEKCGGLRGTAWHKMQVITEFFGSGARAALPGHRAAFFSSFKELARCTKLATS